MWVYQFGYLDEFGCLDELRSFGDRSVWINPLWFWEYHPTGKPQDALVGVVQPAAS